MKIAFFTDAYLDLTGGIVSSMDAQKRALEDLGHTVYIYSTGFRRSKEELKKLNDKHIYIVPTCKVFFKGLVPISRRPKIIEKWLLKNFPELKDFDIFHIHYESGCSIAGNRLGHQLGIPVVQTMHGREDVGEADLIPFGLRTLVAKLLNWFHSWYLPHSSKVHRDDYLAKTIAAANMWTMMVNHANAADTVITPSKHFREKLLKYGVTKNIEVVSNGIDDHIVPDVVCARNYDGKEPLKIVWNSRFSAEKRGLKFLEALKLVDFSYELNAFGSGNDLLAAKSYAKLNRMPVKFYGDSPREQIFDMMAKSHLGVLASYNFDNQPMTILEAEAMGLPVLICDPDMLEVATRDGVFLTDGPEPAKMAEALNQIYAHPELINKMSTAMVKNRENALQSRQIEKLLKIYQEAKHA